jgi:hypothetical protein
MSRIRLPNPDGFPGHFYTTSHGLLHKIRDHGTILRTFHYADDATVFVAPIKEGIQKRSTILSSFCEVTDLCTNFQKSYVVPIHCNDIDLDDILEGLLAERVSFP